MTISRDAALVLLKEYVASERLQKHCFAVEASMRAYARHFGEDEEYWGVCGLLHDLDYEKFPDEHPFLAVKKLEELGYPEDIQSAILGHATYSGVARESLMAKCLFAVDELTGFIVACAYVRPEGLRGMKPNSVKKKLKDKAFAAKVSREEIAQAVDAFGVLLDEHIERIIEGLLVVEGELGLDKT